MRAFSTLLVLLVSASVSAEVLLSTDTTRAAEDTALNLKLTILNSAAEPLTYSLPQTVRVRVESATNVATLDAQADRSGDLVIPPHSFVTVRLTGVLPVGVSGATRIQMTGIETNPLLMDVAQRETAAAAAPAMDSAVADKPPPLALSAYDPVYVIVGGDGGLNAKLQISFRYRLFDGNGKLAHRLPWLDDLYLGYSQTSLWDLGELSKPFRDSSYRPRLFYANEDVVRFFDGRLRFSIETGVGHESNGREADESRSFNMLYARPTLTLGEPDGFRAWFSPLVHNYVAADENEDLSEYRGYVDWQFGVGSKGGVDVWTTLRKGTRSDYGSVELNVSYPLAKLSGGDLTGWLMLQYFNGYGESLLEYQRKLDSQFRLGIAVAL